MYLLKWLFPEQTIKKQVEDQSQKSGMLKRPKFHNFMQTFKKSQDSKRSTDYWSKFDNIDNHIDDGDFLSDSEEAKQNKRMKIEDSDYDEDENMQDFSDRNYSEEMSNRHEQPKIQPKLGLSLPTQMA